MKKGYVIKPLTFNRKMVRASASVSNTKNAIHSFTEVDISAWRDKFKQHYAISGEKLSFTSYIVVCFAEVINQYPLFNAFIRRNKLILLDDVNVSVLVEREFNGEKVPEPVCIQRAQEKTFWQIQQEIRDARNSSANKLGGLSNQKWINYIPGFFLKTFVRLADKNIHMAKTYGKVAVTAFGMYCKQPVWFIPHGTATVLVTVGSIIKKMVEVDGKLMQKEHLCLTVSFDHNIVDGAPAARFMNQFIETLQSAKLLRA